jgi:hypothetical protein
LNGPVVDATLKGYQQDFFRRAAGVTDVSVYREFLPKKDAVEFTMYFYKDEKKYRLDFQEFSEVLNVMGLEAEWYMVGRAVQLIRDGKYRDAHTYL